MHDKIVKSVKRGIKQAREEFIKTFPKTDLEKFDFDVDLSDTGYPEKTYVYFIHDNKKYDITSDEFWKHENWVKYLNLTPEEKMYSLTYGEKFPKVLKLLRSTKEIMKEKFLLRYPQANPDKFEFEVILNDDGTKVLDKNILYKETENVMINIDSKEFKHYYQEHALYWTPRIFGTKGTIQDFVERDNTLPFDITKFKIYVNSTDFFDTNFKSMDTKWRNSKNVKDKMIHILLLFLLPTLFLIKVE